MKMNPALLITTLLLVVSLARADDLQLLSAASCDFSQRLYQKLAVTVPNAVYSPYSIHSALAMTSLGARGETATELSNTLGLTSLPGVSAHRAYHDLIVQLNNATSVTLLTANALFLNPNVPIESKFLDDVKRDYFASSSNFDLAAVGGPEKVINDFVSGKTEGMIKDIVPPGSVTAATVTVLVNTIFFNGTWQTQFEDRRTRRQEFHKLGGTKSQVPMMNGDRGVDIKRNVNGVDVARLSFKGNRFSLYIALPIKVDGVTALETSLTSPGIVDQLFEGLTRRRVDLSIPKFKIESSFELTPALQQMGLSSPFDAKSANFQGISPVAKIVISKILHKAVIEVKETGTVAAAATAVIVGVTSVQRPPAEVFMADHPFLFFLRDDQTKQILFQGKFSG